MQSNGKVISEWVGWLPHCHEYPRTKLARELTEPAYADVENVRGRVA